MYWIRLVFLVFCLGAGGISGQGPPSYYGTPQGPGYGPGAYRPVYTERTYYAAPAPSAQSYWRPGYVDSYQAGSYDRYQPQQAYTGYHGNGYQGPPTYQGYQEVYEAPAAYPAPVPTNHIEEYPSYHDNKDVYASDKDSEVYHGNNNKIKQMPQHARQYKEKAPSPKTKKDSKPVYKETMHSVDVALPPQRPPRPARRRGPGLKQKPVASKRVYQKKEKKEEEDEEGGSGEIDDCSMMKVGDIVISIDHID